MKRVLAIGLALLLTCGAAVAQTTTTPTTVIDLSPVTTSIAGIVTVVLTGILTWLGVVIKNWVNSKIDLSKSQLDEQVQQMFNESVARSMAYAETKIEGAVPKSINTGSVFIASAGQYLVRQWPELTKGMSAEQIRDAIIARLPTGPATAKADAIVLAKASGSAPAPVTK
jgi:hypothetical protein